MRVMPPSREEFLRGCDEFTRHERRDAMYKVATFLVDHYWGRPADVADGVGVLLLTWNQAFYRYGAFSFDRLEACIRKHSTLIEQFRKRSLTSLISSDESLIAALFRDFLDALKIADGKLKGRKSPVAVAKTLHLLAPQFFPLWDDKIAKAYGCYYNVDSAKKYFSFCKLSKNLVTKTNRLMFKAIRRL